MKQNALQNAILDRNADLVEQLLSSGMASPNEKGPDGRWPIAVALDTACAEVVRVLLQHGADVDAIERKGIPDEWTVDSTILDSIVLDAYEFEKPERLFLLLEAGFDPNHRDRSGWVILASMSAHSVPLTKYLLERGADPNRVCVGGWTPLMCAVNLDATSLSDREIEAVVRLMKDHGAKVTLKNDEGETAEDIVRRQSWDGREGGLKERIIRLLRGERS